MAGLVIVINGYLLIDFFVSEVNGLLFGFVACTMTVAYLAFILYLISLGGGPFSNWLNILCSKRI